MNQNPEGGYETIFCSLDAATTRLELRKQLFRALYIELKRRREGDLISLVQSCASLSSGVHLAGQIMIEGKIKNSARKNVISLGFPSCTDSHFDSLLCEEAGK